MKPGREMDALVAEKVMGWKFGKDPVGLSCWVVSIDRTVDRCWSPSTDIAAAWEVVEKINQLPSWPEYDYKGKIERHRERGAFRVESTYSLNRQGKWCAYGTDRDQEYPLFEAYAEIAPHAICVAALKAVGAWPS